MRYIIGIGTYSMFDDSIGLRIVEEIVQRNLNAGFEAIDLSSDVLNLLNYFTPETERIVIVDAAKIGLNPSDFAFFKLDEILSKKIDLKISTHGIDLMNVFEIAKKMNYIIPEIIFMGIEPEVIKNDFGLSAKLNFRLDEYVRKAISMVAPKEII